MERQKVLLVSTGGTISSKYKNDGAYSPAVEAKGFVEGIPEIFDYAQCDAMQFGNTLSFALTPEKVYEMVKIIKEKLRDDTYCGAVVTQGTATMEETSYLADLLWDMEKPLVFTGAMLNASEKDSDGPRNILNSVITAISREAAGKGVLICMAGEIHTARDAAKLHKTSIKTFYSMNYGPIGIVNNKRAFFYRSPLRRRVFKPDKLENKIDIIKVSLGIDSRLLNASIQSGAKGIVIESFPGGGGVTPEIADTIREASKRDIVFVSAPRAPMGSVCAMAGGGCGSWDLKSCGVIMGGDLMSTKARILLMVTLPVVKSRAELEDIFLEIAP
ncbi:MAG TPA: asparaginase [Bacillota bacterium]|nr:asparaginase [Bacillota bacterium]HPW40999.1 asparaginase [Bacillota bacterium]